MRRPYGFEQDYLCTISSSCQMIIQIICHLGPFGGAVNQSPTTFEALANENTVSFGNLAQQQPSGFGSPTFGNTNSSAFGVSSNFGFVTFIIVMFALILNCYIANPSCQLDGFKAFRSFNIHSLSSPNIYKYCVHMCILKIVFLSCICE